MCVSERKRFGKSERENKGQEGGRTGPIILD